MRPARGGVIGMVVEALGALGHQQPKLAAVLLQGVVDAAGRRIELGAAGGPERITEGAGARGVRRGVVAAGARRIERGAAEDPERITEAAVAMALGGVRG